MFTIFKEEKVITTGILVFLGLSILVRLLLAGFYHTMIKETDNMATTEYANLDTFITRRLKTIKTCSKDETNQCFASENYGTINGDRKSVV